MPVDPNLNIQENIFGAEIPSAHSIGDLIDQGIWGSPGSLQFPSDRPKYYTLMQFSQYQFQTGQGARVTVGDVSQALSTTTGGGTTAGMNLQQRLAGLQPSVEYPTGNIVLPLPVNLVDTHKVKYDEKPILPWFSALGEFLGAGTDVMRIGGGLLGLAPNYYYTILFDRPEYKRHEISFKLAPRNFQESQKIRDIIIFLNNAMSPGINGTFMAYAFSFPNIVQVTLKPNAGFLFKFKPSVIEAISFNYAGSGGKKAFYHDAPGLGQGNNPPESVEFTMHLLEIEYWINLNQSTNMGGQFNALNGP